jgi:hypothetical protein
VRVAGVTRPVFRAVSTSRAAWASTDMTSSGPRPRRRSRGAPRRAPLRAGLVVPRAPPPGCPAGPPGRPCRTPCCGRAVGVAGRVDVALRAAVLPTDCGRPPPRASTRRREGAATAALGRPGPDERRRRGSRCSPRSYPPGAGCAVQPDAVAGVGGSPGPPPPGGAGGAPVRTGTGR